MAATSKKGRSMSDNEFAGRRIVITGGGTGIGRSCALAFAARGAEPVLITGRRKERLAEVAAAHPAIVAVPADLRTEEGAAAVTEAARRRGGVDVLVHNAGILRRTPMADFDPAVAREVLETNLVGPMVLTSYLLPLLRSPGGAVVLVSSLAGHTALPGAAAYAASKAAVESLTRTWAAELAPQGIRVNAVAPNTVRTEIWQASGFTARQQEIILAREADRAPLALVADAEDVAPWIVRLAAPSARYVTGQVLTLDGGVSLR
jgi:NAD(P)-dependent dehydrogenase (short-subunit alcohol dehydrogenase family)